jgi:cobalt-precorrin 5A hydrolase
MVYSHHEVIKMKIAILSITQNGNSLAMDISSILKEDPTVIRVDLFHKNVKQNLESIFHSYDCIVGIMATGIMIRNICSLIKNKKDDPAVLIIDEKGQHVISLLSGHLGGGNEFSIKIANIINGEPIITTSTDINNKFGVDCLARKYYLKIDDISKIKSINSALLNNEKVQLATNSKYNYIWEDVDIKNSYDRINNKSDSLFVSDGSVTINFNPKKIVVGLGSRKNVKTSTVVKAIKSALKIIDLPIERIDSLATGEIKSEEIGIITAAEEIGLSLEIVPTNLIKEFKNKDINCSDFVNEKFGLPGICEPSSLIAAGEGSDLIFRKTPYNGVTVAIAVSKN